MRFSTRFRMFLCSVRSASCQKNYNARNGAEKCADLFGNFESVLSDCAHWRVTNDAFVLSSFPGATSVVSGFNNVKQNNVKIIESAILTCIFTKVLSIKDDDDQEEMLKYSEGADKSQFQRQVR